MSAYERRHLRLGWWSVAVFALAGLALETLHAFKDPSYLGVAAETRRLLWTLAHAHGTLLGLVNVAFAATLPRVPGWGERALGIASGSLVAATVLLPAGFFLGGAFPHAGDPGAGIVLVPLGALLLVVAAALVARAIGSRGPDGS